MKKLAAYLLYGIIKLLFMTFRVRVEGVEALQEFLADKNHPPLLVALWHSRLLLLAPLMRKVAPIVPFTVLISKSRDGDIPTYYAELFTLVKVIRVGHKTRSGALLESIDALEHGQIVVLTPDGPRGPAQSVKPGAIFAAEKTGAAIIAMGWSASKAIYFKSWDRFCLPLPFATITLRFEKPLLQPTAESLKQALDASITTP